MPYDLALPPVQRPREPGGPTKFTPARVRRLLSELLRGHTKEAACGAAGISTSTLSAWMEGDEDFAEAVEIAMNKGEARLLRNISKAGEVPRHWIANAWLLERTRQGRYALRVKAPTDMNVVVLPESLAAEVRRRLQESESPSAGVAEEPMGEVVEARVRVTSSNEDGD